MAPNLLEGVIVVEYGQYIAAPYCGLLLADLGATVIKVEDPEGDVARRAGPFPGDVPDTEKSGLFLALNRGKRGVVVDLDNGEGRQTFSILLQQADVLLENAGVDTLAALGFDNAAIRNLNAKLVATSITPFGATGPRRQHAATDLVTFHMSGYAPSVQGGVADLELEPPLRAGGHQAEFVTGLTAATATAMALCLRDQTGAGSIVDVSAQEAMVMMAQGALASAAVGATTRSRRLADTRPGALVAVLPTSDGFIAISPREQRQWLAWVELMGNPTWCGDPRFADPRARLDHWTALEPLLAEWTSHQRKESLYRSAQAAHVPAFPVNTAADLFDSQQLHSRGFFTDVQHPLAGVLPYPGKPFTLSNAESAPWRPAPTLGQHNAEPLPEHVPDPIRRVAAPTPAGDAALPLAGVRVLDFSWVIAGPTCTRMLANLGAEVIKIESRRRPDPSRGGSGGNFHFLNQSKRSLTLNLASEEGIDLAKRLVAHSDVVIENFATGVFERLGLGYDVLREQRADLILVSSSGLGHTGPDRGHVAYGTLIQCFTGWASLTGQPGGRPSPGGVWTDPATGMMQAFVIACALRARSRTGLGQYIDFSMAEVVCGMLPEALMDFAMNQRVQRPLGNADAAMAPHGLYRCAGDDAWLALAVSDVPSWLALCETIGAPRLAEEAELATAAGRRRRGAEIDELISAWTGQRSAVDAAEQLQQAGIAAGASMSGLEVFEDPHLAARGFFQTHATADGTQLRLPGLPWRFSDGPEPIVQPAPEIGQHSFEVLNEVLGLSRQDYEQLVDRQAVY